MPKQIFVDAGFVIALVSERDRYHQQALELANMLETAYLITTDAVLLEIGNHLSRNYKQEAIQIVETFIEAENVEIVELTPELFDKAFETYKKHNDKEWGLVDCLSFAVMWDRGILEVLAFDRHFRQAKFKVLTNITE